MDGKRESGEQRAGAEKIEGYANADSQRAEEGERTK